MPANYALELDTGATVAFTSDAALASATKIGGRVRVLGTFLKDTTNFRELFRVWDGASTIKFRLYIHPTGSMALGCSAWPGDANILSISSIQASLDAAKYYEVEASVDPAAVNRCTITVYDTDGSTVLATASGNDNSTNAALPSVGIVALGDPVANQTNTYDWAKFNDGSTTQFDAELNEGTGTSVSDSVGGTTGTISGTHAWILLSSGSAKLPPPQGNGGSYQ